MTNDNVAQCGDDIGSVACDQFTNGIDQNRVVYKRMKSGTMLSRNKYCRILHCKNFHGSKDLTVKHFRLVCFFIKCNYQKLYNFFESEFAK